MSQETPLPVPQAQLPRFSVRPYTPDGGFHTSGLGMLFPALIVAGGILGYIAHLISFHLEFYLIVMFPLGIGFGVGFVGQLMVKKGRIRNPYLGGAAGFLAGVLAMFMMHYFDYSAAKQLFADDIKNSDADTKAFLAMSPAQQERELASIPNSKDREAAALFLKAARMDSFFDYLDVMATEGVTITKATSRNQDRGLNLGYAGSFVYWLVEILIVAGVTFAMVKTATAAPYCVSCECWKTPKQIGTVLDEVGAAAAVSSGDLTLLSATGPAPSGGSVAITVACCDACVGTGEFDLKAEAMTADSKGNKQSRTIAHTTWPAAALKPLMSLFDPPPIPAQPVEPPPASSQATA